MHRATALVLTAGLRREGRVRVKFLAAAVQALRGAGRAVNGLLYVGLD